MSSQIIPLKARADSPAFELQRRGTPLGAGSSPDLQQALYTDVSHYSASPRRHELAAISLMRRSPFGGKASNTIAPFALDFARQESVCGDHGRRA
jgi:hypothetical protein